ncbi:ATP synthase subunit I [Halomonas marinisediminis]|uniref:F0F1 ATP synthase assembly protein I n=2 Tax=Halomonas TaxID=2745 RepID=A0A7X4W0N1_9GAMM|nr:ATP synthase subunit I [Halomonas marinisediminis]NAW13490.1 F0F1 ATP synthase assembly protein I [Halomonas icarae]TDB02181.1 F0F1 ATP synthase assembly protein I [Halomonas marinisediminis]
MRYPVTRRHNLGWRLLRLEALVMFALVAALTLLGGVEVGVSALSGALVGLLPQVFFVWRSSLARGGRQAHRFVMNLYRAEAGKFGLTVALLAMVFVAVPPSNPISFFSAYVATHLMPWLAAWLRRERSTP